MRRHHTTFVAVALGALLLGPALGAQTQTAKPKQDQKPAPEVTAVTPTDLTVAAKPRAMAITGRYFQDGLALSVRTPGGAVLEYKGNAITDRRETSFNALVTLADVGAYEFVVVNPDGRTSAPFKVQVKAASLLPVVASVQPAVIAKSTSPQTITVSGQRFMVGLSVLVTDPAGNVQTVNSTDVAQVLPESFQITVPLEISGTYEITVKNPDGSVSKAFTFDVQR